MLQTCQLSQVIATDLKCATIVLSKTYAAIFSGASVLMPTGQRRTFKKNMEGLLLHGGLND